VRATSYPSDAAQGGAGDVVLTRFVPLHATTVPNKLIERSALQKSIEMWIAADDATRSANLDARMTYARLPL
jgi:hypothetical protein